MDIGKLNRLIEKVIIINKHVTHRGGDPLLVESLHDYLMEIKLQYGSFLLDKLFDIYDDYFSDSEMLSIEEYLSNDGVEVEGDDFEDLRARLSIKPFPLRIEVQGVNSKVTEVIWQAA